MIVGFTPDTVFSVLALDNTTTKVRYTLTLTTLRLLSLVDRSDYDYILAGDGTFKLNKEASVGLFTSFSDRSNQTHPLTFSLSDGEREDNYVVPLQLIKSHYPLFVPKGAMADGAQRLAMC